MVAPGWTWVDATTNAGWNGAIREEPNNDEYIARIQPQEEGEYDLIYRFSLDAGHSWLYCDLGEGSTNGYASADAAQLTVVVDPCNPNPCFDPPLSACEDNQLVFFGGDGACEAVDGEPECTYMVNIREDCALMNLQCVVDDAGDAACM